MGVRDHLPILSTDRTQTTHYECRGCGTNLDTDADTCPVCGGEVAVYEL